MSFRKKTRKLGCLLPGRSSSSSGGGSSGSKAQQDDNDDEDDCCSRRLIDDNEEPQGKSYNLSRHEEEPFEETFEEEFHPLNDSKTASSIRNQFAIPSIAKASSPAEATTTTAWIWSPTADSGMTFSDNSSGITWPEMTQSFADLELEQSSISSVASSTMTPPSLKSASFNNNSNNNSAPNSPTAYSTAPTSPINSVQSLQSWSCPPSPGGFSVHSAPATPTRTSRLPLTSPLPRRSPSSSSRRHRKSHSDTSNLPMTLLPPPPCKQVEDTMSLLKSIKQQIKALKRRESHLSTKLQVQRRERQQMQEQIAHLEARRLRVEAMFLRPLPLVLLLPVAFSLDDEYDLCLVSEGQDAWNALQPLIRIQLVRGSLEGVISSRSHGAILLHFGPTLTQPMAAAVSFLQQDPIEVPHLDLQPITKQMDFSFWQRTTCGQVLEPDSKQLSEASAKFLFDALTEHKHLWRNQLTHVVDTKTRRIQWILQQEADSLYYQAIPSSPVAAAASVSMTTRALVELD